MILLTYAVIRVFLLISFYIAPLPFSDADIHRDKEQMKRMIQPPVSESSMSMIGLTVKADGTLSFDQDVFNKATDASPSLMGSIAERVASGIKQDAQRGLDAPSASLVGSAAKQQNMFGSSAFSSSQMDSISMMSTYNRLGAYNMSNYYAVGMMMNMFV